MPGKYKPPASGNLPARGKKILAHEYESIRSKHPEWTKERCAREAWYIVENHGFKKYKGKWFDTHSTSFMNAMKRESKEHKEFSKATIMKIVMDHGGK
jgi:hypothetical protein